MNTRVKRFAALTLQTILVFAAVLAASTAFFGWLFYAIYGSWHQIPAP